VAQQSENCTGQMKKSWRSNRGSRQPLETLRHGNQGIVPALWKITVRQLGYCAG
jgi:hypothetical protein